MSLTTNITVDDDNNNATAMLFDDALFNTTTTNTTFIDDDTNNATLLDNMGSGVVDTTTTNEFQLSLYEYTCQDPTNIETCATTCTGLQECMNCHCAVIETDVSGNWGEVMDVIFCLLPIIFLIVVTIKPNPMPTTKSLPLAALWLFLVRTMYLGLDPLLTCGSVLLGLHEALTPLSIMAGAITLFESMESTKCLPFMMREMKALTAGHPIAELMLIFCFAYMIEGASGFGTPVALGAPMLVSTGHDPLESVVVLLIMNTFATVWGAVGTPIWFGFDKLTDEQGFQEISYKAGIALAIGSFLLIPLVLTIIVPWNMVKSNGIFVMASLCTVVLPSVAISFVSYEFPSLIGGLVGCMLTSLLIKYQVGLKPIPDDHYENHETRVGPLDTGTVSEHSLVKQYHRKMSSMSENNVNTQNGTKNDQEEADDADDGPTTTADNSPSSAAAAGKVELNQEEEGMEVATTNGNNHTNNNPKSLQRQPTLQESIDVELGPRKEIGDGYIKELILRTSPIWLVVVLLVLTRVQQIGLKPYLTKQEPYLEIHLGTYGTFRLSASLVFQMKNFLSYPGLNWKFELLYLPFLMPFVLVSGITLLIFRKDLTHGPKEIAQIVAGRLYNPAFALLGALALVQLLIKVGTAAPAWILGNILADWFQEGFIVISPLLGMLGSFFSGSTTVSNLTFGPIQKIAAESIGVSPTTMLALQAVGGSAGNGICLNNIIAACAVVGLDIGEGQILKRTVKYVLSNGFLAIIIMLAFFFRF